MLPTFQSFDDKKITKTFPKRPIKLPKQIASKALPTQKIKQMSAMTTSSSTTAIADVINESAPVTQNFKSTPHPTTIPSTPISHTLFTTTDSNNDCAMIESSIQVSKHRLEALYTQFEENKNKIVDSSLQSKIHRSGSLTNVLSIISKFEMKKTEVEVESKYLEEAKQNYIQALAKYDKKTIEALKEVGNITEEFNGLIVNLEKLPSTSQDNNLNKQPITADKEVQACPPRVLFKSPSAEFLPTMQIVPLPPSPILRSSIKSKNVPKGNVTPVSFKFYNKED
ncbi:unnamed protein product [Meloidogyne enterolobii]|uniref:Uncharacterized protein n=1 Tax=Meloidogyne enterolobii TaxID=390850 RepID=A0ACB0XZW5_MELEN